METDLLIVAGIVIFGLLLWIMVLLDHCRLLQLVIKYLNENIEDGRDGTGRDK